MTYRLWYPQLDVYDSMRRLCLLLGELKDKPLIPERLYIADFFLASPPLLHKTSMPQEIRNCFHAIQIMKPEKAFLDFPPAKILFNQMEPLQIKALSTLLSKEIVSEDSGKTGEIQLTENGQKLISGKHDQIKTEEEASLLPFLCHQFIKMDDGDISSFRNRTGLRRLI